MLVIRIEDCCDPIKSKASKLAKVGVDRVNIDYIKANHFRTIAPSGVMSSITPQGQVQFALFSERQAIPQRIVHEVDSSGNLGKVLEQVVREAIVREVEVAVTMDRQTAILFAHRLLELAKELDTLGDKENN